MRSRRVATPAQLRLDPMWDSFRGDPRFEELAAMDDVAINAAQH